MFDHVGVAVSDLPASERFYRAVLSAIGIEPDHADAGLLEWEDWCIGPPDGEHPVTRGLHIAFRAPSAEAVLAFGGVLTDPDGNTVEAVVADGSPSDCHIDHIVLRVRDPAASARFYETIGPAAGLRIGVLEPDRVQVVGEDFSFWLVADGQPLTENVHFAFPASDNSTVQAFHAAAIAAGYSDHGAPGERPYHPGYYAAFVLDPDGFNVEVVNHNL